MWVIPNQCFSIILTVQFHVILQKKYSLAIRKDPFTRQPSWNWGLVTGPWGNYLGARPEAPLGHLSVPCTRQKIGGYAKGEKWGPGPKWVQGGPRAPCLDSFAGSGQSWSMGALENVGDGFAKFRGLWSPGPRQIPCLPRWYCSKVPMWLDILSFNKHLLSTCSPPGTSLEAEVTYSLVFITMS